MGPGEESKRNYMTRMYTAAAGYDQYVWESKWCDTFFGTPVGL